MPTSINITLPENATVELVARTVAQRVTEVGTWPDGTLEAFLPVIRSARDGSAAMDIVDRTEGLCVALVDAVVLQPLVIYEDPGMHIDTLEGRVTLETVLVDFWPGTDNERTPQVRYTLTPMSEGLPPTHLVLETGRRETDEGYTSGTVEIEQTFDACGMPIWQMQAATDGRDCDGRLEKFWSGTSLGLPDTGHHLPDLRDKSVWDEETSYQRDYAAEAAGY